MASVRARAPRVRFKSFEVSAKKTVSFRPKDTVFWSERYSVLGVKHTVIRIKRYSVSDENTQCFGRKDTVFWTERQYLLNEAREPEQNYKLKVKIILHKICKIIKFH